VYRSRAVDELAAITPESRALSLGRRGQYTMLCLSRSALSILRPPSSAASGSRQIRNLFTIAGNLARASPSGTSPCLIALDATVTLDSPRGRACCRLVVNHSSQAYRKSSARAGRGHSPAIRIPLLARPGFCGYKVANASTRNLDRGRAFGSRARREGRRVRAAWGLASRAMRPQREAPVCEAAGQAPAWLAESDALLARDFTPEPRTPRRRGL